MRHLEHSALLYRGQDEFPAFAARDITALCPYDAVGLSDDVTTIQVRLDRGRKWETVA